MLLPKCPCCASTDIANCCACNREMLARKHLDLGNPDSVFQMGIFQISYLLEVDGEVLLTYDSKTDGEPPGLLTTGRDAYAKIAATTDGSGADYWAFSLELSTFFWSRDGYVNLSWALSQGLNPSLTRLIGAANVNCNQEGTGRQLQIWTDYAGYSRSSGGPTSAYYIVITSSTVSVNDGTPASVDSEQEAFGKTFTPDDELITATGPTGATETLDTLTSVEFAQEFSENWTNYPDSATAGRFLLRIEYIDPLVTQWKTCYTDDSEDADPASGHVTGTCRKLIGQVSAGCRIARECECQQNELNDYTVFFPGGELCECCCYPSQTSITSIEGLVEVDNPTHTFGPNSRFSGLPAKVFVTDASDERFGEGSQRVVVIPAEIRFPFGRVDAYVSGTKRGSFSYWEYNPIPCGEAYAWAYWSGLSCGVDNAASGIVGRHLYWASDSDCSVPVYRSVPFESTGLDQGGFDDWVANETIRALNAHCSEPGWDWNFYVQTAEFAREELVGLEYQIAWTTRSYPNIDNSAAAANYPRWELDIVTNGGSEKLSGRYTQSFAYNERVCKILRTKTFGTGDGFSVPIMSDDCWPEENPLP